MSDFQNILSIILAENFKEDEVRGKYSTKMLNINKIIRIVKLKDVCKRKDADGRTILYSVIKYKLPLHVILAVLTQYPDICKETDNLKNLPIHFALDNCAPTEVLLEMLRIYPESCKVREMQGLLPLHFAAWSNVSIDVVRTMIEIYPQACSERENSSFTPFSLGVWNSCSVDTLKLMMSVHPKCCEEQNTFNGDFPLHLSAAESNDKVMQVRTSCNIHVYINFKCIYFQINLLIVLLYSHRSYCKLIQKLVNNEILMDAFLFIFWFILIISKYPLNYLNV